MIKQFEQRLRRLEQQQQQEPQPKKKWVPQWLSDGWHKQSGLPFDTEERGLASMRRIQQLQMQQHKIPTVADPDATTT